MTEETMSAIKRMHRQNSEGVTIKIKTFGEGYLPEKIVQGDWIDLRARGEYIIKKGDIQLIKLGVAMELPAGYEAVLAPRSSMAKNFGIMCANSFGVIDHSYCGDHDEWGMFVFAIRDTIIKDGDRICQFRIQRNQPKIEFEEVESLGNPDRNGFGSTGKR
jgi:dUTP pyrophosphatase